jgi:uncharacterized protein YrrD
VTVEHEQPHLTGHDVVGQHGEPIGKAGDVLYDEVEDRPAWIQVDQGLLHSKHTLVPAEGAYQDENGTVVVPFDKDTVKNAPKVKTPVALTGEVRQKFEDYYGVRS